MAKKIQIEFSKKFSEIVRERSLIRQEKVEDYIKNAISVFIWLNKEVKNGSKIRIIDTDKNEKELDLFSKK